MRFNVRVGPNLYLRCHAKISDPNWFGEAEMMELMSILESELPQRVPQHLHQTQFSASEPIYGSLLQICLRFIPNNRHCWLLRSDQPSADTTEAHASTNAMNEIYASMKYTLLILVEPYNATSASMRTAHDNSTQMPIEQFLQGGTSCLQTRAR